jgi:hypothetical protein
MRRAHIILRATILAWSYAVTLGCLYGVRLFLTVQTPSSGISLSRFQGAAEAVLRTSPMIVIMSSFFALLVIPLAAWAVGSASWGSLKKSIYVFWLVLALDIVASGNADGLILISGAGLIALWFLRNRGSLNSTSAHSKESVGIQVPLQTADSRQNITAFTILAVIACALSLFLLFGNGTKAYVSEMFAIYAVAAICEGFKAFATNAHGPNASSETAS